MEKPNPDNYNSKGFYLDDLEKYNQQMNAEEIEKNKSTLGEKLKDAMEECERLAGLVEFWQNKYYELSPPHQRIKVDNL